MSLRSFSAWGIGMPFTLFAAVHCGSGTRLVLAGLLVLTAGGPVVGQVTFVDNVGSGLNFPLGVAINQTTGQVYVADYMNNRVVRFAADGTSQISFGSFGANTGQFNQPIGIGVNSSGQVYVVDRNNNRVQRFDGNGVFQAQFGSLGTGNGQFTQATNLALNSTSGQVYVMDGGNNRIERFAADGTYQTQFGSAGSGNGQFSGMQGLAINSTSGQVFIGDTGNNRVQRFDADGGFQTKWGTPGTGAGQFNNPTYVGVSAAGRVFVDDFTNSRNQRFDADGVYQTTFGAAGNNPGQNQGLAGVAVSQTGVVYVADIHLNHIQRWFAPSDWIAAGTNNFPAATVGENLTLQSGYILNVTGQMNVNSGVTLSFSGGRTTLGAAGATTAGLHVNNGGTLGGAGTIVGNVDVNSGGILAPGFSPGTLTISGDIVLSAGALFQEEVNGATVGQFDVLADIGGNVTLGGNLNLAFGSFATNGTEQIKIVTASGGGTLSGVFANFPTSGQSIGTFNGENWAIYYTPGTNGSVLLVAVPEPGGLSLLGAAGVAGWRLRRRVPRLAGPPR
jgi:sugar lactone lactonase YvrE